MNQYRFVRHFTLIQTDTKKQLYLLTTTLLIYTHA